MAGKHRDATADDNKNAYCLLSASGIAAPTTYEARNPVQKCEVCASNQQVRQTKQIERGVEKQTENEREKNSKSSHSEKSFLKM